MGTFHCDSTLITDLVSPHVKDFILLQTWWMQRMSITKPFKDINESEDRIKPKELTPTHIILPSSLFSIHMKRPKSCSKQIMLQNPSRHKRVCGLREASVLGFWDYVCHRSACLSRRSSGYVQSYSQVDPRLEYLTPLDSCFNT